jgi:predicted nucleic acid-binding protein
MKVIIDTNVLVSAVLRDGIPRLVIRHIIKHEQIEWLVTDGAGRKPTARGERI